MIKPKHNEYYEIFWNGDNYVGYYDVCDVILHVGYKFNDSKLKRLDYFQRVCFPNEKYNNFYIKRVISLEEMLEIASDDMIAINSLMKGKWNYYKFTNYYGYYFFYHGDYDVEFEISGDNFNVMGTHILIKNIKNNSGLRVVGNNYKYMPKLNEKKPQLEELRNEYLLGKLL